MASAAETSVLEQISEDFLQCSICLEQFKTPKTLPCLHTFCQQCLVTLVEKKGSLSCPTCSTPCQLPEGGVSALKDNFFMTNLIEIFQQTMDSTTEVEIKCEGCEEKTATQRCLDCQQFNCDHCVNVHRNFPALRSHRIITTEEYTQVKSSKLSVIVKDVYCTIHPDQLVTFYCNTCQTPVCTGCTIVNHRIPDHSHSDLKVVAEEYRTLLRNMVDKMKVKEEEIDHVLHTIKAECNQLEDKCKEEEREIHRKAEEIIKKTREEEERMVDEIKRKYNQKKKDAQADIDKLELTHGNIKGTRNYVETLVHHGNAVHLLSTKENIVHQLQTLIAMETKLKEGSENEQSAVHIQFNNMNSQLVRHADVCIGKCTVDIESTEKGKPVRLVITTRDDDGNCVISRQEVKAMLLRPDGSREAMAVSNQSDGTYLMYVYRKQLGNYQVNVTIRNEELPTSPIIIQHVKGLVKTMGRSLEQDCISTGYYGIALNKAGDIVTLGTDNKFLHISMDGVLRNTITTEKHPIACSDGVYFSVTDPQEDPYRGNNHEQFYRSILEIQNENGETTEINLKSKMHYQIVIAIAVNPANGNIYILHDRDHRDHSGISIYDKHGEYVKSILLPSGKGQGEFSNFTSLIISSTGHMFIPDRDNHRIQVFTQDGEFLYHFGCHGKGDGELTSPSCIAIDKYRHVYVGEKGRVQKFEMGGRFICRIDNEWDGLEEIKALALTDDDPCKVVVLDNFRIEYKNYPNIKVLVQLVYDQ
ncbi:tripartite motif-containing protein 2-like [Ptychodera flava]|uniref:tripartite motif-containing protein 2-like n=1 Tax=Ptychodera flava TaxID=63121 RepID=UPI00396A3F5C